MLEVGYCVCKIIGDAVNEKEFTRKLNIDEVEMIQKFAKRHNLESILGCALTRYRCYDDTDIFRDSTNNTIFRQMKFDAVLDKISNKLSEYNIRHIVLKGNEIQKFYPDDILRYSTDIDLYIDKKDIDDAKNVMESLGFTFNKIYNKEEYQFKMEPRYNVEVHITLEGFTKTQKEILLSLADNAEHVKGSRHRLNNSDCYIHTLFHLYKHFISSGVGVRMFLDIYMIKKHTVLNTEYIETVLKKLDIFEFSKVVDKINDILFDNKTADKELDEVINFIFQSGTFGTTNTTTHLNYINNELQGMTRFQKFNLDYGISFDAMKNRYPILEKAPFLYPFSFIHRFIYGIIHKKEAVKNDINLRKSISNEKILKYERVFRIAKIIK